jgi:hypothetical protein
MIFSHPHPGRVMLNLFLGSLCLVTFHSPDGRKITIDRKHIVAIRSPIGAKLHLAPHTNALITVEGRDRDFGVLETPEQAEELIKSCGSP